MCLSSSLGTITGNSGSLPTQRQPDSVPAYSAHQWAAQEKGDYIDFKEWGAGRGVCGMVGKCAHLPSLAV